MNLRSWALAGICVVAACGGRTVTVDDDAPSPASGGIGGSVSSGGSDGGGGAASVGGADGGAPVSGGGGGAPPASGGTDASGGASNSDGGAPDGSGGSVDSPLRPCNSSDGSGCEANELCVDDGTDSCFPDRSSGCEGACATKLAPSSCEGGVADCNSSVTCPGLPAECPEGQVHSIVDECWGPCVPADCCACQAEFDCWPSQLTCDREAGRCFSLTAPEPRCRQPFVPGECDDQRRFFAFIEGSCQERTASSCGQAPTGNRFDTLEECLWRCEGLPTEGECPEGRVAQRICLECGAGGGCSQYVLVCAKTCEDTDDCDGWLSCLDGVCGVNGCH